MNSRQIESRVRRIVAEAQHRGVWESALQVISDTYDFGSQKVENDGGCAKITHKLRIFTGTEFFHLQRVTSTGNKHFAEIEINRSNGEVLFKAHLENNCSHPRRDTDWKTDPNRLRHIRRGVVSCLVLEAYRPGQWEKILEFHEAVRLLEEERAAKASLAIRKGVTISEVERQLAMDFGLKV